MAQDGIYPFDLDLTPLADWLLVMRDSGGVTDLQRMSMATLITQILNQTILPVGVITHRQAVLALTDAANNPTTTNMLPAVDNAMDPLGGDAASADWRARAPISRTDAISAAIQAATGWSSGQMDAFFTLARSKPL